MSSSKPQIGHSGFSSYSPISNLEKQWAPTALRVYGSVNPPILLTVSELVSAYGHAIDSPSTTSVHEELSEDNPFGFLNEEAPVPLVASASETKKKPNLGRFLKKVAATTTASLERGMHSLAVKADQGRNADLLVIGCYFDNNLLGFTESVAVPEMKSQLNFSIPFSIPSLQMKNVVFKVWVRSGAALLGKAAKNYLIGTAIWENVAAEPSQLTLNLTSPAIMGGQLTLLVEPSQPIAPIGKPGWSLADPRQEVYGKSLHHLPLYQTYRLGDATWSERTTESAVVLPVAACMANHVQRAVEISQAHWQSIQSKVQYQRHDQAIGQYVDVNIGVAILHTMSTPQQARNAVQSLSWQRPDQIFETLLLEDCPASVSTTVPAEFRPTHHVRFFAKPSPLNLQNQPHPTAGWLGNLHYRVTFGQEIWHAVINIETIVARTTAPVTAFPVTNSQGQQVGTITMSVTAKLEGQPFDTQIKTSVGGLIELMGLDPCLDGTDFDQGSRVPEPSRRQRHAQLKSMGYMVGHQYAQYQANIRQNDCKIVQERAQHYHAALQTVSRVTPPHLDKEARPFRPSSSRSAAVLSGLPFNCHTASWVSSSDQAFLNVTCGAPADHARGFGSVLPNPKKDPSIATMGLSSGINFHGGLRRLESQRMELAKQIYDIQTQVTVELTNYQNANQTLFIPADHAELQGLRWQLFEKVQSLNHVTWQVAMRRASCFSQALGLALTSLLGAVCNADRRWAPSWKEHGFLVSFEGLLSAAGKELGMIEDASVAIAMLSNVRVVFCAKGMPANSTPIPHTSYLQWLCITPHVSQGPTTYTVEVGMTESYCQTLPSCLQNQPITFVPLLFEVGVDIHQWGAHQGTNVKSNMMKGKTNDDVVEEAVDEDDDDDANGVPDDDVLVQLNYEAFQKMNAHAWRVYPQPGGNPSTTHPQLQVLHEHILSSAGKITHDILDEAAALAQQLGGGGLVFCKSGKDRTAMHVTYKQAQFANRKGNAFGPPEETLRDAELLRIHGTRLPICEKNVGEAKYAFNSLQIKFMPQTLKPPQSTVAGFLKGGKVFTGGAIES